MSLAPEVRQAARGLRRNPGFAAVAAITLALGIGATTAIFSVVDAVLLRPLPYPHPDRLVRIWSAWEGSAENEVSPAEYFDDRDRLPELQAMGAWAGGSANLTGGGEPERLAAAYATASLFPALGVAPALGRTFTAEEDRPGGPAAAILSDGLWRRRFGGSAAALGRRVTLDGQPATVVGVMPPGFRLPDDFASSAPVEVYLPLAIDRTTVPNRGSHYLAVVGRLAPGVSPERAREAVARVAAGFVREFPDDYPPGMRYAATTRPVAEDVVGSARPSLLLLLGAVGLVLAIACSNVAGLLLARSDERRREMALRSALGAGRGRLARQVLVESLILAAVGGALGVTFGGWGVQLLGALLPPGLPRFEQVGLDPHVLGFALAATFATGLVFGLVPALHASRPELESQLREGGRGAGGGPAEQRFGRALVVGEIALALTLLVGAGLLARGLVRLVRVDPGFRPDHVLTVPLALPETPDTPPERTTAFFRDLVDRVAALPGVASVGAVTGLPLDGPRGDLNLVIEGRPKPEGQASPAADWQAVTPGYFRAIGMRVLSGRGIERTDTEDAPGAVVINRAMARLYWPGEDPLGNRFTLGGGAGPGTVTIVGIVDDVRHRGLDAAARPEMYIPHAQFRFWNSGDPVNAMSLVVRTAADPAVMALAIRRQVASLDPDLPVGSIRAMESIVSASVSRPRFTAVLLGIFSAVALVLAAVGIYGVLAQIASRRTREMGVRMALGAGRRDLLGLLLRQTLALTAPGVGLGLAAALALTRLLRAQLYGVSPTDPATFAGLALVTVLAALAATWAPARRVLRLEPSGALRAD